MIVKVPEQCFRKAGSIGIRNEVVMYYRLKTVNVQGYFKHGVGVNAVSSSLQIDTRTVRRWFSRLHNLGLLYKDSGGYGLVKYDRLFSILGYDLSQNSKPGRIRLGKFKIFKIRTSSINKLIIAVAREEISLNMQRQGRMIKRKSTPRYKPDKHQVGANTTISLSCRGVSKLLGFKSQSSGSRIEKQLLKHYPNTIKIDQHVEVISVDSPFNINTAKLGNGFYKEGGIVFKRLSNRIHIH